MFKILTPMDKAMANGVYGYSIIDNIPCRQTRRCFMIGNIDHDLLGLTVVIVFDIRALCPFDPYPIGLAFENKIDLTAIMKVKDLVTKRRAPCVKDQYMHNIDQN